ncbi:TIGR02450 family Trp-rich protein [Alginatibacterium sediminis]|uniref:TIGR02450 family Trp-rich protein n=1 Tax=Alginatibacterium sediminis TaxID=2164068 RepID=A0A420EDG3_9ALTE|nr:TIGR02450 family Trp-rich protein [Alginatibacterium sediminis]RKF18715.1 TIGR02450 family Trp-rich protein [Alginatibacterium sediminis]
MNRINPKKLLNSKWTSVSPKLKEKHFIISELELDEDDSVLSCCVEAVLTKRIAAIDWRDLKDSTSWIHGWK